MHNMMLNEAKTIMQNYMKKWEKVNRNLCYAMNMVLNEIEKEASGIDAYDITEQQRFTAFTTELTKLLKKYGFAIKSIGGVCIFDAPSELTDLRYSNDASSGDLTFDC